MDYKFIKRDQIPKRHREDWDGLLAQLTAMNAVSIACPDEHTLRLNQFCLYRAAKRRRLDILTFKHHDEGQLTLTIWLSNIHRMSSP